MTLPPEPPVSAPYIGLRPYTEAERALFFGRERDALLLRNKILASPLTVLYAMSGVGKSSLLRALVEPLLREQEAHVVYYDSWAERDPAQGVALELRRSIPADLRAVAPGASLATVARAAATALDKPIVLVLDQFEKLLLQRGQALEPLGVELASLVHDDANVHVVLSLREEFVASLDVLRSQILTLFSSTYRLRPLDEAGVREAIERPAEQCGGKVDPDLVDALVADLRGDSPEQVPTATGLLPGHVELPFLQLVCSQLWTATEGDGHHLTLARYKTLGRRDGIIRAYVRGLIQPLSRRQRSDLARLLDLLAPRSGAKMSFAAQDLSHNARVSTGHAAELLDHLAETYVVRVRSTPGSAWYELYHDAFIGVLRSWVDEELKWVVRRRWRWRGAIAFLGLQALLAGAVLWNQHVRDRERTSARIDELIGMSEDERRRQIDPAVDDVARWVLAQAQGADFDEAVDRLLSLLDRIKVPIQRQYAREDAPDTVPGKAPAVRQPGATPGTPTSGGRSLASSGDVRATEAAFTHCQPERVVGTRTTLPLGSLSKHMAAETRPAPARPGLCGIGTPVLSIAHGARVTLDRHRLEDAWREVAFFLADSLGIPPPNQVVVVRDSRMHPEAVSASLGEGSGGWVFDLSWLADSTLIAEDRLSDDLRDYLHTNARGRWTAVAARAYGGRWWRVPRWTLPLWHAGGAPEVPAEQLVALAVLTRLTAQPDLLLTRTIVRRLVQRAAAQPSGHRGSTDSVRAILLAIVGTGHSIRDVRGIVAALPRGGEGALDSVALRVWRAATEASCRLPSPGRTLATSRRPLATSAEFGEVLRDLPLTAEAGDRRRGLAVCFLERAVAERRFESADSALTAWPAPDTLWTPQQNYLLGYWMLYRASGRKRGDAAPRTWDHLAAAFKRWPDAKADSAYRELRPMCVDVWVTRQCWAMLDSLARLRDKSFPLAILAGFDLSRRPAPEDARAALENLNRAGRLLGTYGSDAVMQEWIDFATARARLTLAEHGDSVGLGAAIERLGRILDATNNGPDDWEVRDQLMTYTLLTDRPGEADSMLDAWPSDGAESTGRQGWAFFLDLAKGRTDSALALADRADGSEDGAYMTVLASLLAGRHDQDSLAAELFLTDHDYRDYIRLMQFWSLSVRGDTLRARQMIEARWAAIDTSTWRDRAQAGDRSVWRETLIGMYAHALSRERVLGMIATRERFGRTYYPALGFPLRGLQCEAYFYDGLLQAASGDTARAVAALGRARRTKYALYYEYHMAGLLLERYTPKPEAAR